MKFAERKKILFDLLDNRFPNHKEYVYTPMVNLRDDSVQKRLELQALKAAIYGKEQEVAKLKAKLKAIAES